MNKKLLPKQECNTGYLVHRADRFLGRALADKLAPYEITLGMYHFLRLLWIKDGLAQHVYSNETGLTPSTTASAMKNLEGRQYIKRSQDKSDNRRYHVFLTQKGRDLSHVILPVAQKMNDQALQGLTEKEQSIFWKVLESIPQSLARAKESD